MKALHMAAYTLLWVGGLNLGLVGLLNYSLIESLLGLWPFLIQFVYILIGAATVYVAVTHKSGCKICGGKKETG